MKYKFACLCLLLIGFSCNESKKKNIETNDSLDNIEMEKVDQILLNEDSILKSKELEFKEKYGH